MSRWSSTLLRCFGTAWRKRFARLADAARQDASFVRAYPDYILVEERLEYDQEVSRNPSSTLQNPPVGQIKIKVPYDGGPCFGLDARDDAAGVLCDGANEEAVVGHLVFAEYEETNLDSVLGLRAKLGSYPIRLPLRSTRLCSVDDLTSDQFEYRHSISYQPSTYGPLVVPIAVKIDLFDPGHGDGSFLEDAIIAAVRNSDDLQRAVASMIKDSAEFEPHLTARITVRLSLPPRRLGGPVGELAKPTVRSVRVTLPDQSPLPLASVALDSQDAEGLTLQIDSRAGSFDWCGQEMAIAASTDDAPRVYTAPPVEVRFLQPGELFRQREIAVDVDVELPDELLSGTQVRYFGAIGEAPLHPLDPLRLRTIISAHCKVLLHDAFGQRRISPSQSFCFDEIIPDNQRVGDVVAALVDQRFSIELEAQLGGGGKKRIERLIIATRRDGPRTMQLWIYVDGRRQPTTRESRHPWGHRYRSKFESGTLSVHVRGLVHGDARGVTHEINALHLSLRERFQRMKSLR